MAQRREATGTSEFGSGRRENHDSSGFYDRFSAPVISADDTVNPVSDLGDGCILGADESETVDAVPCEVDHNAEVFAIFELANTEWPGGRAVARVAESGCIDRFRGATGHVFDPVHVAITGYAPSERSWDDARKVLCVVTAHDLGFVRGRVTK